jgi:hypothetical protein
VPLTADLIRRQYHLLTARLAPERVQELGPEFTAIADSKRAAIHAAAEELIHAFAEQLELPEYKPGSGELRHNPDLDEMFGT